VANAEHTLLYSLPQVSSPAQELSTAYFPSVLQWTDNLYLNGKKLGHPATWKALQVAVPKPTEEPKVDYSTYRAKTLTFADISPVKTIRLREEQPATELSKPSNAGFDD
jgi:hypothetical protein